MLRHNITKKKNTSASWVLGVKAGWHEWRDICGHGDSGSGSTLTDIIHTEPTCSLSADALMFSNDMGQTGLSCLNYSPCFIHILRHWDYLIYSSCWHNLFKLFFINEGYFNITISHRMDGQTHRNTLGVERTLNFAIVI